MPSTYEPLATTTLGSNQASVTFSSVSSSYTDLVLVCNAIITTGGDNFVINFNSDTSTNYSVTRLTGNSSSATSSRATNQTVLQCAGVGTTRQNIIIHMLGYSNSNTYKTVLTRYNDAGGTVAMNINSWRNNAAINNILISTSGSTFATGSIFSLYGIKAA
jgi:hypothetical protein